MKNFISTLLFLFSVISFSIAQVQQQWINQLLNSYNLFLNTDIAGNIYVIGTNIPIDNPSYTGIRKFSPSGTVLFSTSIDSPCSPVGVVVDSLDNRYIAGYYPGGWAPASFTIAKISPLGTVLWRYRDAFSPNDAMIGIAGERNGSFYIFKYRNSQNQIIKYNSSGVVQSSFNVADTITGTQIALDNNGNIIITGSVWINSVRNSVTIKYSPAFVKLWKNNFTRPGGTVLSEPPRVKIAQNNNIYLLLNTQISSGQNNYTLIKYITSGTQQWVAYNNANGFPTNLIVDSLENIYITGWAGTVKYNSSGTQVWMDTAQTMRDLTIDRNLNVYATGSTISSAVVRTIKISTSGARIWSVTYGSLPRQLGGTDIALDTALNVIIIGYDNAPMLYSSAIVVKYNQLVGVNPLSNEIPSAFSLYQNFPNPFNPTTKIRFDIPNSELRTSNTELIIYDILGREIATLVNEELKPGTYEVEWDASNYPSGVYFYKLISGDFSETRKMVLTK